MAGRTTESDDELELLDSQKSPAELSLELRRARLKVVRSKKTRAKSNSYVKLVQEAKQSEAAKDTLAKRRARAAERSRMRRVLERRSSLAAKLLLGMEEKPCALREKKIESLANGSPLFCTYNPATNSADSQMKVSDLGCLLPGKWITDNVIDWFVAAIVSVYRDECFLYATHFSNVILLSKKTGTSSLRSGGGGSRGAVGFMAKPALEMAGRKLLLFPTNVNGNHWILGAIVVGRKEVIVLDSLYVSGGTKSSRKLGDALLRWVYEHERQASRSTKEWKVVHATDIPRQSNSDDCGVHVCDNARVLVSGLGPTPVTHMCTSEESTTRFRYRLLVYSLETAIAYH